MKKTKNVCYQMTGESLCKDVLEMKHKQRGLRGSFVLQNMYKHREQLQESPWKGLALICELS